MGTNMNENWPQQEVFCERVKRFCEKNGCLTKRGAVKLDVAADLFNISEVTLKQFLYHKTRKRPHFETLLFISSVIGCSVNEFTGAPDNSPPGVSQEKWGEISERERMFASTVLNDMIADNLSLAEKELLFGVYQDLKTRLIWLKGIKGC